MKLQKKLIVAIVMSIIISMLLLAIVVFTQLKQRSEYELFKQMDVLLNETQYEINVFEEDVMANGKLFSTSHFMESYAQVKDAGERYDLQPALLRLFTKYQRLHPEYIEIRYLLPDGYEDTRVAIPGLSNHTVEEQNTPYFTLIANNTSKSTMNIVENPDNGETVMMASTAIRHITPQASAVEGHIKHLGYLVLTVRVDALRAQVEQKRVGKHGYIVVLDNNKNFLFHPDKNLVGQSAIHLVENLGGEVLQQWGSEDLGYISANSLAGEKVYVFERTLNANLTILGVLPHSELLPGAIKLGMSIAVISLFAILATSFLLFWLLSKLVLIPVSHLRELALGIGEGKDVALDVLELHRDDEMGDLARAFYAMNSKLVESMHKLKQSHAQIEQLAYKDSLTALPNRRLILELVDAVISRQVESYICHALLYLDLDKFKQINDSLGHEAGDELLRVVAQRLLLCVKSAYPTDQDPDCADSSVAVVGRIGGDEFVVLSGDLEDSMDAGLLAEDIIQALEKPIDLFGQELVIGVSIGIACFPDNGNDVEHLMQCADTAMYVAKRFKHSNYRFYSNNMDYGKHERIQLERDLKAAIEAKTLALHYQPQVDTRTKGVIGLEALLRWIHPKHGFVSPEKFVGMAEDMGLIGELGEWVLDEACRQWSLWQEQGIAVPRVAVNVSQKQFSHGYLPDIVESTLLKYSMPPEALELEITESCMMEVKDEVLHSLNLIRKSGVSVAMDDFGTGYSSLGSLTSLPIDILKIDRSFVSGVQIGEPNEKIVSAILSLAHNLGLKIVAEGVETQSEYEYLLARNCEICQGYLFSKPLTVDELNEKLGGQDDELSLVRKAA